MVEGKAAAVVVWRAGGESPRGCTGSATCELGGQVPTRVHSAVHKGSVHSLEEGRYQLSTTQGGPSTCTLTCGPGS